MSRGQQVNNYSFTEIYKNLSRALVENGKDIKSVTEDFRNLKANSARVDFAYKLLGAFHLFPTVLVTRKCEERARRLREEGNRLFKIKESGLALLKYTESISNAPLGEEDLALAYANRSAVLCEQRFYKECLKDIENALSNNYPNHLHEKLLHRKQKAESFLKELTVHENYFEELPHLTYPAHPSIDCASDCIEIRQEESLGRHIVASRNINVGDIIAIERPFSQILLKDNYLTHCYECLTPCYNLIPCDNCALVLFCDKICKDVSCHTYECPILGALLDLEVNNLELIALKICMLVDSHDVNSAGPLYKSERYTEIHNLVTNTHLRSVSDLFERSVKAAVMFELMQKHTHFFAVRDGRQDLFKELLLLHMQTGPSNFHEISELRKTNTSCSVVEIGSGAYGFLSLINHSCSPNIVRHCYGNAIVLRALRPIIKGSQLFDNYGYHHAVMPKSERQKYLKSQYYFDCGCEACSNDWPLYHDLPVINYDIGISESGLDWLGKANRTIAKNILERFEKVAQYLEQFVPCKELADVQEIVKQCYAILGNKWQVF